MHWLTSRARSHMRWPTECPTELDFELWRDGMHTLCPSRSPLAGVGHFTTPTHKIWQWKRTTPTVPYVVQATMGVPRMSLWLDGNQTDFITHVPDHLAIRVLSVWSKQHMPVEDGGEHPWHRQQSHLPYHSCSWRCCSHGATHGCGTISRSWAGSTGYTRLSKMALWWQL